MNILSFYHGKVGFYTLVFAAVVPVLLVTEHPDYDIRNVAFILVK